VQQNQGKMCNALDNTCQHMLSQPSHCASPVLAQKPNQQMQEMKQASFDPRTLQNQGAYHGSRNLDTGTAVLVSATISVDNGITADLLPDLEH